MRPRSWILFELSLSWKLVILSWFSSKWIFLMFSNLLFWVTIFFNENNSCKKNSSFLFFPRFWGKIFFFSDSKTRSMLSLLVLFLLFFRLFISSCFKLKWIFFSMKLKLPSNISSKFSFLLKMFFSNSEMLSIDCFWRAVFSFILLKFIFPLFLICK